MHIPDGILPLPVTIGGYAASCLGVWLCLRRINKRPDPAKDIPKASVLTAVFFVASLIHIPLPPASIHLLLGGLLGMLLGLFAIPAITIGLFFQAILFGHGGLTTLGVNGVILGFPPLLAHVVFRLRKPDTARTGRTALFGFLAGAGAAALSVLFFAALLIAFIPADLQWSGHSAIIAIMAAHGPLILIEGLITAMVAAVILRTAPRLLQGV